MDASILPRLKNVGNYCVCMITNPKFYPIRYTTNQENMKETIPNEANNKQKEILETETVVGDTLCIFGEY